MANYNYHKTIFESGAMAIEFLEILFKIYEKSWGDKGYRSEFPYMYFDEIKIYGAFSEIEFSFRWVSPDWVDQEIIKFSKLHPKSLITVSFFSESTSEEENITKYLDGTDITPRIEIPNDDEVIPLDKLTRDTSIHNPIKVVVGENINKKLRVKNRCGNGARLFLGPDGNLSFKGSITEFQNSAPPADFPASQSVPEPLGDSHTP